MYSAGTLRRLQPHSAWFYSVYVHLHSGQSAAAACSVTALGYTASAWTSVFLRVTI